MKIVILDTMCCNLLSITSAVKYLGIQPIVSNNLNVISHADKFFLPGIGTVHSIIHFLNSHNLINFIKNNTRPILGICLGMQILGYYSEENKRIKTLEIISNYAKFFKNNNVILPHIGWNKVKPLIGNLLFNGIDYNSYFYFMHSYYMPLCLETIAQVEYGNIFSAAIQKKNFFGVQFHPEKSGESGFQILKNFLEI